MHSLTADLASGILQRQPPPHLSLFQPTHRRHPAVCRVLPRLHADVADGRALEQTSAMLRSTRGCSRKPRTTLG